MVDLAVGLPAGLAAGVVFFGGLRWTVAKLTAVRHPALLAAGSFILRTGVVVAILLVSTDGRLLRILAALGGFLIARTVLVSRVRRELQTEGTSWT
jgi:F1F0 ATPase subunit 2